MKAELEKEKKAEELMLVEKVEYLSRLRKEAEAARERLEKEA